MSGERAAYRLARREAFRWMAFVVSYRIAAWISRLIWWKLLP
jgi:hypothetical protein